MAFFKKLKDKLFKSSSKLEEGLDAIVEDGGEEEPVAIEVEQEQSAPPAPDTVQAQPEPTPGDAPVEVPEPPAPMPEDPPQESAPVEEPIAPPDPEPEIKPVREDPSPDKAPQPKPEAGGLLGRLLGRTGSGTVVRRALDDDMLEQLEELLITADMGVDTALRVTANMAEGRFGKKLSTDEIKQLHRNRDHTHHGAGCPAASAVSQAPASGAGCRGQRVGQDNHDRQIGQSVQGCRQESGDCRR